MFSHISDVLPRLRVYEQLFTDHERLVQAISAVYLDILKFCADAKDVFRHPIRSLGRLPWKPFERQFGMHLDAFRKHKKAAEEEVSISHMIEAASSRESIRSHQIKVLKDRHGKEVLFVVL